MKPACELGHREIHPAHLLVAVYREESESAGRQLRSEIEDQDEFVTAVTQRMEDGG